MPRGARTTLYASLLAEKASPSALFVSLATL
jgi:hypothetical protein